ncbi:glycosyltransferase family 2 protein [Dorea formicigenerans]|uniref:Glycosyltransferase family 2 protein n=1 Tax=Dorea formicigenerans TaxID=39486 RepID=A0A412MD62_9FIRM|nr:glycosyltransferase family 2 protein [Dorea formicigenerans]RGT08963.1 glycosyltransferase family 2 protein [Dorea formicigenerans]RHE26779.1 glycosyltransferase family 2 protein [Dorea formicigenerans]
MNNNFDIPVALFLFKRSDTVVRIIDVLADVKPKKIYLLSDQGRNENEKQIVAQTRKIIEKSIDWECEVIKNYALENRGVYRNIGEGAKWVFEHEKMAIFLEDDNLPEISFFSYCKELLEKYENTQKVLWICGTNYLGEYTSEYSYMFTQHLLPCGWASWSDKFLKFYDGEMLTYKDPVKRKQFCESYKSKALLHQRLQSLDGEYRRKENNNGFKSWDYQMLFSLRSNELLGVSPVYNQIRNIGADQFSIHGGTSLDKTMTKRFCEIPTKELDFPLKHPDVVEIDEKYEKLISNIILLPIGMRIKMRINSIVKKILHIDPYASLSDEIKKRVHKK